MIPRQTFPRALVAPTTGPITVSGFASPRLLAELVSAGERPLFVMFESLIVKVSVGFLCLFPAFIFGAAARDVSEQIILFGGAITAATVVWAKVIRPLIQGINNLNDAYRAAVKAEQEIRELKEDITEIKEKLNGS